MSNRTESNPFALARAGRIRIRAKLLKAELNARHDAAPDDYLSGDIVMPPSGSQESSPGLFNDILDRMAQPPKALPIDELDDAAQQFRELLRQYGVPVKRVLEENRRKIAENHGEIEESHRQIEDNRREIEEKRRKIEEAQRKIDGTIAARSKGGKISGKTRVQKTVALDAAVREILPTLSGSHRKQPQSAGAIQAVRDKLPTNIKESYKSGSAISKSIGRVRGGRTRGSSRVPN
jgi:hypothetical protein